MAPKSAAIALGVSNAELVIHGGLLKHPIVLDKIRTIGGKQFVTLWKNIP